MLCNCSIAYELCVNKIIVIIYAYLLRNFRRTFFVGTVTAGSFTIGTKRVMNTTVFSEESFLSEGMR